MNSWLKISVYTTRAGIEPLFGALLSHGIEGVEVVDEEDFLSFLENNRSMWDFVDEAVLKEKKCETHLNIFIRNDADAADRLSLLKECLERLKNADIGVDLGSLRIETEDIPEDFWFENWKKYYVPLPVGDTLLIVPEWVENPDTERTILKLNPGMLFGTGTHSTTRLCMEILEKEVRPEMTVLDIGCGSGILSILSLVLGAKFAAAVDIDAAAPGVAYENAALNGILKDRYLVTHGDILEDDPFENTPGDIKYDIVVSNIVADVIIPLSAVVSKYATAGALFLCSGIIEGRVNDVCDALEAAGFKVQETRSDGEWYAMLCKFE